MKHKIVSISIGSVPQGMPQHFIVGAPPLLKFNDDGTTAGNEVPDSPNVSKIVYPLIDIPRRVFPDPCYIIHFEGSPMRRVIPIDSIIDVGYMSTDNMKAAAGDAPDLPAE